MPFSEHKRFVVRKIAAEVARAQAGRSAPGGPESQVIAQLTQAFVAVPAPNLISNQALQALLDDQLKVVSNLQVHGSRAHRTARDKFIDELAARINENRCDDCGAGSSHTCDGTALLDKQKLESVGFCVRSIAGQFQFLRKVVRALVARHAFAGDTSSLADVDVQLAWNFPPQGQLAHGTVVGRTQFHDAAGRLSEVTLELDSQSFGWQSLLSVPLLLAHEVVCHAYRARRVCDAQCVVRSVPSMRVGWTKWRCGRSTRC